MKHREKSQILLLDKMKVEPPQLFTLEINFVEQLDKIYGEKHCWQQSRG